MNPKALKPLIVPGSENESPAPSLRSIVRKSALLNLTIILTSFPVLVFAGGPQAVVPTLAIYGGAQRFDLDRHVHTVLLGFACPDFLDSGLFRGTA